MDDSPPSGVLLLCLDLQASFLGPIPERELLTRRVRLAVAAAQGLGLPIVFTEQVPTKLGPTLPELTELAATARVFPKTTFSAFGDEAVQHHLRESEAEHLLVCGIETSICVYQTVIEALNHDLQVTVLSDAVGARRPADGAVALAALTRAGAHVLPTETVMYSLLRDARHPFFKRYTELVKSHG